MKKSILLTVFLFCCFCVRCPALELQIFLREEINSFQHQYPYLQAFSCEEIAKLANHWMEIAAQRLMASKQVRKIDPQVISEMLIVLEEPQARVFMRHGEQVRDKRFLDLNPNVQKIEMMRYPNNQMDGLTVESIAEWIGSLIIWDYLQQKTKRDFLLQSSENKRAEIPTLELGALWHKKVLNYSIWNCVDYPPEEQMSREEILKLLPDGTLPWEESKVDRVIGRGTYAWINRGMREMLAQVLDENTVFLAMTHTQQLNAITRFTDLPSMRLGNYGFIVITQCKARLFAHGFYERL